VKLGKMLKQQDDTAVRRIKMKCNFCDKHIEKNEKHVFIDAVERNFCSEECLNKWLQDVPAKEKNCTNCIYENCNINDVPCKRCEYGGGNESRFTEQDCKFCKYDSCTDWEEPCVDCATENRYEHFKLSEHYKSAEHETKEENNAVQHPAHYQGKYECIEEMRALFGDNAVKHFCMCNAYKYRFRAGKKQGEEYEKDIAKAEWYMGYLMEMENERRSRQEMF
jgi:hypothetical protein